VKNSTTQIISLGVALSLFLLLVFWYANDVARVSDSQALGRSWPEESADRGILDKVEEIYEIDRFAASGDDAFRFWHFPSVGSGYVATVEFGANSEPRLLVSTLTSRASDRRPFSGPLKNEESAELIETLDRINFWREPPGKLDWACTDGAGYLIETNLGGRYRAWANACSASPGMRSIADFFEKTVGARTADVVRD